MLGYWKQILPTWYARVSVFKRTTFANVFYWHPRQDEIAVFRHPDEHAISTSPFANRCSNFTDVQRSLEWADIYAPRNQHASALHDVGRTIDTDELARYEFPAITDAIHTTELIPRLQVTGTAYIASDPALSITFSDQVRHTRTADQGVSFQTGLMMCIFLYVVHNSTWSTRL